MRIATSNPFAGLDEIVQENHALAKYTWYKIGGPAKYFIRPRSVEELQEASKRCVENEIPIFVLGLGANLLISDVGVNGAVFRLDDEHWRTVKAEGNILSVGIESLAGIPGTVGGGIRMNAGGKFGDIGAVVTRVGVMDQTGLLFDRLKDDLVFDYRSTNINAKFILNATLELEEDDPQRIMRKVKEIWMYKRNSQPLNTKNAGCIFKNPRGLSAGALIDQAGLKGLRIGGAEVSSKHANFVIAHPGATADDVLRLVKEIREKVFEKEGLRLESEVQVWGAEKSE
jgi:UDP-N-acetylmuramate dehydrogenase